MFSTLRVPRHTGIQKCVGRVQSSRFRAEAHLPTTFTLLSQKLNNKTVTRISARTPNFPALHFRHKSVENAKNVMPRCWTVRWLTTNTEPKTEGSPQINKENETTANTQNTPAPEARSSLSTESNIHTPFGSVSEKTLVDIHEAIMQKYSFDKYNTNRRANDTPLPVDRILTSNFAVLIAGQVVLITVYFAAAYYGAVVDAEWVTVIAKNLSLVRVHEDDLALMTPLQLAIQATKAVLPYLLLFPLFVWPYMHSLATKVGWYAYSRRRYKEQVARLQAAQKPAIVPPEENAGPTTADSTDKSVKDTNPDNVNIKS